MSRYFLHQLNQSATPIFFRRVQGFAGARIHINLNLLSQSLGDGFGQIPAGFSLVPSQTYAIGGNFGDIRVQPRVITDGTRFRELPMGPRLKNLLDYPVGDSGKMNLRPPFYDTTLSTGQNGGGWFRRLDDDRAWHGGLDVIRGPGNDFFEVCAAAAGTILGIQRRDNAPVVLEHEINGNAFITVYQHLDLRNSPLRTGQAIGRGQPLGRISSQPNVPHLHFMVAIRRLLVVRRFPLLVTPEWFAIDAFGVYDYYERRTNSRLYNYVPGLPPNCWNRRIQGATHPPQWERQPLASMM